MTINRRLLAGESMGEIARDSGLSHRSVSRHRRNHLPAPVVAAFEAERAAHTAELVTIATERERAATATVADRLATVTKLLHDAQDILETHKGTDPRTALLGIREAGRMIELLSKMHGDIDASPTVNVTFAPIMVEMQAVVLKALTNHPAARADVLSALSALDGPPVLQIGHDP